MSRAAVALVAAALLAAPPASAAEGRAAPGTLNAFACAPLQKAGLRLELRRSDDSPEAERLAEALRRALAAEGVGLAADASASVTVAMRVLRERGLAGAEPLRVTVRPPVSFHDDPRASRRNEPVVPLPEPPERHGELVDQVQVALDIHDKSTGRCLWHGAARYALERREPWLVAEPLVGALAAAIGSTVRAQSFDLDLPPHPIPGVTPLAPRPAG